MLRLELLPAGCGDCLWLEYCEPGETHIVLIDGGVKNTATRLATRIQEAMQERGVSSLHLDLLVVTHIDNDHIDGILKLLEEGQLPLTFDDIWFNGNQQLKDLPTPTAQEGRPDKLGGSGADLLRPDLLGLKEGDRLSRLLADPNRHLPWNKLFGGKAVFAPDEGALPAKTLLGGLKVTLLGPPLPRLRVLANKWQEVLGEFERAEQFGTTLERPDLLGRKDTWPPTWQAGQTLDDSTANGSSISLLVEYGGKELVLAGDAFAPDMEAALARVQAERGQAGPLPLAGLKLPHHGSFKNFTEGMLARITCRRYLISTDGSSAPRHPDHQTLLRILKYSAARPLLSFNYKEKTTQDWQDRKQDVLKAGSWVQDYDTKYPDQKGSSLQVELG